MAIERILVATDLEPKSATAIRYATYLAQQLGAKVVVVHVVSTSAAQSEGVVHRPGRTGDAALDHARAALGMQLADLGVEDAETDVRFGDPGLDIIAAAHDHQCGLIVLTVQSRSRLGKLLMGSHAQQVLLDSPTPVVGVKPDWQPPA